MAEVTDPALELADLLDQLNVSTNERGDDFLAGRFEVEPWSAEFYQIVSSIVSRTATLEAILKSTKANPAVVAGATNHLAQVRQAFSRNGLAGVWSNHGQGLVSPAHSSPIRMLSAALPAQFSYPKLTNDERDQLLTAVSQLLDWLRDAQLSEKDFIRESLIEGLEQFSFRLQRLSWFGWGYSIESLRDVILAYLALERGLDPNANPDAGAVLKKVGAVLKKVFKYASAGKDVSETGDWLLTCYRFALVAASGSSGYIAGLLT